MMDQEALVEKIKELGPEATAAAVHPILAALHAAKETLCADSDKAPPAKQDGGTFRKISPPSMANAASAVAANMSKEGGNHGW